MKKKFVLILSFIVVSLSFLGNSIQGGEIKRDAGVNPHDHINDEGEIQYNKCIICHKDVPDVKEAKSIEDVTFRFDDLLQPCYSCHPQVMHPGGGWLGATKPGRGWTGAPDHWVKPPFAIEQALKRSEKRFKVMVPLNPVNGEIICATCHNPHERGLLKGLADLGADHNKRWRTRGMMICLYCHEKG